MVANFEGGLLEVVVVVVLEVVVLCSICCRCKTAASKADLEMFVAANSCCMELEVCWGMGPGKSLLFMGSVLIAKFWLLIFLVASIFPGTGINTPTGALFLSIAIVGPEDSREMEEGIALKAGTATPINAGDGMLLGRVIRVVLIAITVGTTGRSWAGGIGLNGGTEPPNCLPEVTLPRTGARTNVPLLTVG